MPAITPATEDKSAVNICNESFKCDNVTISFTKGQGIGPTLQTFIDGNTTTYSLRIYAQEGMVIGVPTTSTIERVEFTNNSMVGDLRVRDDVGSQENGYKVWVCEGEDKVKDIVDTLRYKLSSNPSKINTIVVDYTVPSVVLKPETNIADGSIVQSFDSLTLTFLKNISIEGNPEIMISNGTETKPLTVTVKDNIATLKLDEPIMVDGTYTIVVPEKSFKDVDGFENEKVNITFTVKTVFNYVSIDPAPGLVQKIPLIIKADYGEGNVVGYIENNDIRLYRDEEPIEHVDASIDSDAKNIVIFQLTNLSEEIVEKGNYSLRIPAGTIFNKWKGDSEYEKSNPELIINYVIDEPQYVQDARKLLENEGVGYPTKESDAYKALETLVNAETTPTEAEVSAAVAAYYAEKNVVLPNKEKWYQIAAVNAEGKEIYLTCTEGTASFTEDVQNATAFEVVDSAETFVLRNAEKQYLTVAGVTAEEETEIVSLTLAKLDGESVKIDDEATFDAAKAMTLFTINGKVENALGETKEVYSLVNIDDCVFITDASIDDAYYQAKFSSAFKFTEVEKPASAIEAVEAAYTLTPKMVASSDESLTLTLTEVENVKVAANAKPYFTDNEGKKIENVEVVLKPVEGTINAFTIPLKGLAEGDYRIVLPEGTFVFDKDEETFKTLEITEAFSIHGINYDYNYFQVSPSADYVKDVDLNNILIMDAYYFDGLVANPDAVVRLALYDTNETITTGHLVNIKELEDNGDSENPDDSDVSTASEDTEESGESGLITLKVVFDKEIKAGDLKSDMYAFVMEKGTLGDNNFGKYLNDKNSISPSECHANGFFAIPFKVNNELATGISDITVKGNKSDKIYNLFGERVNNITVPGIYIINGKKVVVRK